MISENAVTRARLGRDCELSCSGRREEEIISPNGYTSVREEEKKRLFPQTVTIPEELMTTKQPQYLFKALSFASITFFFFICALLQVNDPDASRWITMYVLSGVLPSAWSSYQAWQGCRSRIVLIDLLAAASIPLFLIVSNVNEAMSTGEKEIQKRGNRKNTLTFEGFGDEKIREISGCCCVLIALVLNSGYSARANAAFIILTFIALFSWTAVLMQGGDMVNGIAEHCRGILGAIFK